KSQHVAVFTTGPAPVALAARVHVKRRTVIVVEGAEPLEGGPDGAQVHVAANDIDDIVGLLDLLDEGNPVIRQRAPVCRSERSPRRKKKTHPMTSFSRTHRPCVQVYECGCVDGFPGPREPPGLGAEGCAEDASAREGTNLITEHPFSGIEPI